MEKQEKINPAQIFTEYENGVDYKNKIDLYTTVDLNERFYAGDHWYGIESTGVPKPVFNFLRRVLDYLVSAVRSRNVKMVFTPMKFRTAKKTADENVEKTRETNKTEETDKTELLAEALNDYATATWERLKIDSLNQKILLDGGISGNGILYFYWDEKQTSYSPQGDEIKGDINAELIDSVNFFPGDPNCGEIQQQPYLILSFRRLIAEVQREAKENGVKGWEDISDDENRDREAGDRAKEELNDTKKVTCLLKLWKNEKTGTVWAVKCTKDVLVKEPWDTGLSMYPVANFCWRERKNSFFGVSELKEVIPNQVVYNKMSALQQISLMNFVSPKVLFDNSRVKSWSNKVGGAIPVNGSIGDVARYLEPPSLSSDSYRIQDDIKGNTQDCMGANDVALGNVRPENTSAFVMMREASMAPLENIQTRFYQFIEDMGRIWLCMWSTYYQTPRLAMFDKNGEEAVVEFDPSFYRDLPVRLKIEVGASSQFSEITTVQTLDNLLANGIITPEEYLERLPSGYVPKREEVMARIQQEGQEAQAGGEPMPQPGSDSMNEQQAAEVNQLLQGSGTSVPMPQDIMAQVQEKYGGME
ncbi:hypothetical protein [Acetivibrio sp. MSJd-27]|uniref:portal protein n=1 Tax=Acetivibrio sp. MSJd-27 TaxID=2841523 RepID=UPI001C1025AF|nr:hypothetical protein [Acetivibrio sp. MSJd-27]MBU5449185.1 hypothetical protein [Acetivibrio sp. MSJd-27]